MRELKLDRSFVTRMAVDEADAAIVRSTVELARHLHLDVVAEGVEDAAVLAELAAVGCWAAQGYHVGRPVPADELLALVDAVERGELGDATPARVSAAAALGGPSAPR